MEVKARKMRQYELCHAAQLIQFSVRLVVKCLQSLAEGKVLKTYSSQRHNPKCTNTPILTDILAHAQAFKTYQTSSITLPLTV